MARVRVSVIGSLAWGMHSSAVPNLVVGLILFWLPKSCSERLPRLIGCLLCYLSTGAIARCQHARSHTWLNELCGAGSAWCARLPPSKPSHALLRDTTASRFECRLHRASDSVGTHLTSKGGDRQALELALLISKAGPSAVRRCRAAIHHLRRNIHICVYMRPTCLLQADL
jgi:hypothetical protein